MNVGFQTSESENPGPGTTANPNFVVFATGFPHRRNSEAGTGRTDSQRKCENWDFSNKIQIISVNFGF